MVIKQQQIYSLIY